jgi:hypothetical protein
MKIAVLGTGMVGEAIGSKLQKDIEYNELQPYGEPRPCKRRGSQRVHERQ